MIATETRELVRRTRRGIERVRPVGEAPDYWVSDFGRTYTRKRGGRLRRLKQQTNPDGYKRVSLWHNGKRITRYVHRLVLFAFVGPCPAGQEGCHGPAGQTCNEVGNLRWDTPQANVSDRIRARYGAKTAHLYEPSESEIPF